MFIHLDGFIVIIIIMIIIIIIITLVKFCARDGGMYVNGHLHEPAILPQ
jgi:hypothetical protein